METQKEPYKDYGLLQGDSMGFHVSLGECIYRLYEDNGEENGLRA